MISCTLWKANDVADLTRASISAPVKFFC